MELYTKNGTDWQLLTQAPLAAGLTVLYVPSSIIPGSNNIAMEMGSALTLAESELVAMEQGLAEQLPLFRLMVKILSEWDAGADSPYFPWLNIATMSLSLYSVYIICIKIRLLLG